MELALIDILSSSPCAEPTFVLVRTVVAVVEVEVEVDVETVGVPDEEYTTYPTVIAAITSMAAAMTAAVATPGLGFKTQNADRFFD